MTLWPLGACHLFSISAVQEPNATYGLSVPARRRRSRTPARTFILITTTAIGLVLAISLYLSFFTPGSFDLTTIRTAGGHLLVLWTAPNDPASSMGVASGALVVSATVHHGLPTYVIVTAHRHIVLTPDILVPTLWDLLDTALGFFMLALGLVVRLHSAKPAARAFWRLSLLASLALALNPATTHGTLPTLALQGLALRLFGPALLMLVLAFARPPTITPQWWRTLLYWLPALLLVALYPFYWLFLAPLAHVVPQATGLALAGYILAAGGVVAHALPRPRSARQRAQLHWVALGLLGGLLPFEFFTLLPLTLVGRVILAPEASILAVVLLPCCIALALLRVDIAGDMVLIHRMLRILVGMTALVLLVSGVAYLLLEAARLWDLPLPTVSAGIGLTSTLLVAALGRHPLGRAERLLSADGYDPITTGDCEPSSLNSTDDVALTKSDTCLTPHEMEVLEHLARGLSNKEIARQLGRSVKTVEKHVASIFTKLDVHSRLQAVTVARRLGLVPPD